MTPAAGSGAGTARPRWAGDFVLLSAIWGASFLFMDLATVEFGAVPTAAVRVTIAALFLMPLLLRQGLGPQLLRHWKPVFVVGLLNSGIPFALYCFALLTIPTGLSAVLNATAPLFGAAVAWLWLNDRLNASRVLGLFIGLIGVALLVWNKTSLGPAGGATSASANLLAIGACLLACLCYGTAASFTKRYLVGLPPLLTAAGSQLGAALGLALPALWLWPAHMPGARSWLSLLALGVLCTGLAYILYPADRARGAGTGAGRDLRRAGVRGAVWRGVSGRACDAVDDGLRRRDHLRHGAVDRPASARAARPARMTPALAIEATEWPPRSH